MKYNELDYFNRSLRKQGNNVFIWFINEINALTELSTR